MANICSNNFYVTADSKDTIQQVKDKFETLFVDKLIGDLSWVDDYFLEGYFDSKWVFPMSLFKDLFEDIDNEMTRIESVFTEKNHLGEKRKSKSYYT